MFRVFLICLLFTSNQSVKLPPHFKKCNRQDPNLQNCVLEAAQNAMSQLKRSFRKVNLPNLEPLKIKEMSAHVRTQLIKMDEILTDCEFNGVSNVKLQEFKFDLEKQGIFFMGLFPNVTTHCNYNIQGEILRFPINATGLSKLNFMNFNMSVEGFYDEEARKGKTYIKLKNVQMDGKPTLIRFQLYNEDKVFEKQANQLVNDNWMELYDDIKTDYFKIGNLLFLKLAQGFFNRVSIEEAFD